ncbi:hypothetical protein BT96DRAFT_1013625 [Gymnopus androsaceus JB14]|uniref:Uncharacterized protein n=1 Tax=Gymnopus androsaceus JB14 TaxID=1447944 RepID=A0A6A4IGF4_9AGAR|nr:hypothetical protein BT96DRAFT_1013625 [Gymnopus androsaceus JB14]
MVVYLHLLPEIGTLCSAVLRTVKATTCRSDAIRLDIHCDLLAPLSVVFSAVFSASSATNLTALKLHSDSKFDWDCDDLECHFPLLKETRLQSLLLKGVCSRVAPPLVGLTHLEIHTFSPSYAEFRDLFAANQALSTLCLPNFVPKQVPEEEHSFIDASCLRSFSVGWKTSNISKFIEGLAISKHFSRENGLQKTHTLRLNDSMLDTIDKAFWGAFENVTHNRNGFSDLLDASSGDESDTRVYFPNLTSLFCEGVAVNESEVFDTICTRSAMGLSRVELPFYLQDTLQQNAKAKLNNAGIELIFVNTRDNRGLVQIETDSDMEDYDHDSLGWTEYDSNYDSFDEQLSPFDSEDELDDFDNDNEYAF